MDIHAIYMRTAKGSQQISHPDAHMPARLRSLLTMLDGRTPVARVCELLPGVSHMPGIFSALESQGLIERVRRGLPLRQAA
jgi:hypothetical protein